ncbi:MAG TPA: hypothetical protein VKW78_19810 [Terriglobales bacterium]|nr:hypothetical protein [Terriglobales bacterium]
MATSTRPLVQPEGRPELREFPEVVEGLVSILGRKLTAYIASISDARAIDRWIQDRAKPQRDVEPRIRLAYQIAGMLRRFESPAVVQAWFTGLNPDLNDRVPINLLREGDIEVEGKAVLDAARTFVA